MNGGGNSPFGERFHTARFDTGNGARQMRLDATSSAVSASSGRKTFDRSAVGSFKRVAVSAMDCAVAHWYLVPGLEFQRFRVRLGFRSLFWRGRLPNAAAAMALQRTPSPSSYLGFHFASRFLPSENLGNYLDVSSPWLFPLALLSSRPAVSATILSAEATRLRNLLSATKLRLEHGIQCEGRDLPLDDESYDTVTSLWFSGGIEHNARSVRNLWRVLKPGGTLLLSMPCTGAGAQSAAGNQPNEKSRPGDCRLYDAQMLERDIFQEIGQPKRYAIYGAQTSHAAHNATGDDFAASSETRGALEIGREWRCYANLHELPGAGVIVMKFTRSAHSSAAGLSALKAHTA
jgi:SAM-dependent methyltransferase